MVAKYYVFWHEDVNPPKVEMHYDTWDNLKHISRTGCKGFKKWGDAAAFADELQQHYMDADLAKKAAPVDDEGYLQSLIASSE